ncbi:MAG TPA: EF-P lysine aminoacylase EpmA, partial [Anaeromyxobacteraceae bacterium]|nr:EF-P lysine aminoacylase EpmA [Anaeromyxobacteraceae bacterium]
QGGGPPRALFLHTSPEYAMKRLLAEGFSPIFQFARVFRNGEISPTHNPEFTLLEFYRAGVDYQGLMAELESLLAHCARALLGGTRLRARASELDFHPPFERLTMARAFEERIGIDLAACRDDVARLRVALVARGLDPGRPEDCFDDLFFRVFLEKVEPTLGRVRPTFLTDWPASMAALSRRKRSDPRFAERFELYAGGLELANGFSELTDATEQRQRLEEERALRTRLGRPAYPIDERFLAALPRMPESAGVAVGVDRLLMLFLAASSIEDVLFFPAHRFWPDGGAGGGPVLP